jgi:DNA invertase Pin-like site-specific DNA recombinase
MVSMSGTPVDAYIRVSRLGDRKVGSGSFISPEEQLKAIQDECQRSRLSVMETWEELDESGGNSKRPLWNKAIERVESRATRGIVVWRFDRFARSGKDALAAIDRIERSGGTLYSASEKTDNSVAGVFTRNMFFLIAEMERERAKEGFRVAQANAIARGVYIAARTPFGFVRGDDRRLHPDPDKARLVRELFERRVNGESWSDLVRWFASLGITTTRQSLRSMISNPAYVGVARGVGGIRNPDAHEPLVSKKLWDQAQWVRRSARPREGSLASQTLLQGIVTCASCGYLCVVGNSTLNGERVPTYYCNKFHSTGECPAPAYVVAAKLDEEVVSRLMAYLNRKAPARHRVKGADTSALDKAQATVEQAQYDLDAYIANSDALRIAGQDLWNKGLQLRVERVEDARAVLEEHRFDQISPDSHMSLVEMWESWTPQSKREFLARMLRNIILVPAYRRRNLAIDERVKMRLYGVVAARRWILREGRHEPISDEDLERYSGGFKAMPEDVKYRQL